MAVKPADGISFANIRVVVRGRKGQRAQTLSLDATARYSAKPNFSAVARDSGFPISIAAQLVASGSIRVTGVRASEMAIPPKEFLTELSRLGNRISGSTWR